MSAFSLRVSILALALALPFAANAMDPIAPTEPTAPPQSEPAPAPSGRPAKPAAPRETAARSVIGDWVGSYVCAQGPTGLTLTIDRQSGERFAGYFHFYPVNGNPGAAEGCFSVEGRVGANGALAVGAAGWISRPPGYVTVNLAGRLNGQGHAMSGRVIGPWRTACAGFGLQLRSEQPEISGACRR